MKRSNRARLFQSEKPFYEVWYFKLNEPTENLAFWGRMTLLNDGGIKKIFEKWAIVFLTNPDGSVSKYAAKETLPIENFKACNEQIGSADTFWSDEKTKEVVKGAEHSISWDLNLQSSGYEFDPVPLSLKVLKLNKTTVLTPHVNFKISGELTLNGKSYSISNAKGSQGHIWGTRYARNWEWANCNMGECLKPFAFEMLSAQVQPGGLFTSPPLTAIYLRYGEHEWVWNSFSDLIRNRVQPDLCSWKFFTTKKNNIHLEGLIETPYENFAGVKYEDTDGSILYCHNSKISKLTLKIYDGEELIDRIRSSFCAFEKVERTANANVRFVL